MSKYRRWYDQLISDARHRAPPDGIYIEIHHIVPRSLGGGDEPSNTVELTYREHFLAHWLLTKFHDGRAKQAMVYALHTMTFDNVGNRVASSWRFEVAKRALKRLVVIRAKARYAARRDRANAERAIALSAARSVPVKIVGLKIIRGKDRSSVGALAGDFLRGQATPLNNRLRRRRQASNAKDKLVITEAKPKHSRLDKRTRNALKLRRD